MSESDFPLNPECAASAKRLREKGWDYQRIEWLGDENWDYLVEQLPEEPGGSGIEEEATEKTLLQAMQMVEERINERDT